MIGSGMRRTYNKRHLKSCFLSEEERDAGHSFPFRSALHRKTLCPSRVVIVRALLQSFLQCVLSILLSRSYTKY